MRRRGRRRGLISVARRGAGAAAHITPIETTKRQQTSAFEGILCSMHTPKIATHTGTDARITWFMESSITVSEALLHAIWNPFITAIESRPFQSFASTDACLVE